MKAILTEDARGVPDGEVYPRRFKKGDEVTGDLAEAFLSAGVAKLERSLGAAPQNKALKGPSDNRFQPDMDGRDGGDTGERAKPKPRGRGGRKASAKRG